MAEACAAAVEVDFGLAGSVVGSDQGFQLIQRQRGLGPQAIVDPFVAAFGFDQIRRLEALQVGGHGGLRQLQNIRQLANAERLAL